MLSSIIVAIYFQYAQFDSNNISFMARILYFGEYVSGILSSSLIVIGCCYQLDKYIDYFNRCVDFLIRLEHLSVSTESLRVDEFVRKFHFGYGALFSTVVFTDLMYNNLNFAEFARSSTVYSIPNIMSVFSLTQYFLLLHIVAFCIHKINEVLETNESDQAFLVHHFSPTNRRMPAPSSRIERVRVLFMDLCEFYDDVNESFGLLLVSIFCATFIILSIQFYAFYTVADNLVPANPWLLVYSFLWVVLHGGKAFLVLLFNHFISVEVRKGHQVVEEDSFDNFLRVFRKLESGELSANIGRTISSARRSLNSQCSCCTRTNFGRPAEYWSWI